MPITSWITIPRVRRGVAASAVVLATGGLVLLRAEAKPAPKIETYDPPHGFVDTPATGSNLTSFAGAGLHGTFALSHASILPGKGQRLFADMTLVADPGLAAREHAPLAMVVVLDTSGSMSGEKIEQARTSIARLLRDMKDDDEVALVRYSDTAELVQPLARVGSVREALIARVDRLDAGGGTAIPRGLAAGLAALSREDGDRVKRVVLVSDGLDGSRAESERLASSSFERGVTISSMGIGLDFDESYMGGLARAGHGNFGFVNDGAALASFLQRELKETAGTTVENARVRMTLPEGLSFVRATGADARADGASVELAVGSLFAGEERRVLVELSSDLREGRTAAIEGSASWTRVGGAAAEARIPAATLVATNDAARIERGRDGTVLARAVSVEASERQLEATRAYAQGDKGLADTLIRKNIAALAAVQAIAPAPAASAIVAQSSTYESTRMAFDRAAPESSSGKYQAKAAAARDFANSSAASF